MSTDRQIKPFAAVLAEIAKGAAANRVSEALADLVVAVQATEKKGTLTLTLTVEPIKGADGQYTVSVNSSVKLPQEQTASIFYADDEGKLLRSDPRQTHADLRGLGIAKTGETA